MSAYKSGRTQDQFIRIAVIEGSRAYVPPGLFNLMQENAASGKSEMEKAEEMRRLLMLRIDEWELARVRGLEVVVDYEMENVK